MSFLKPLGCSLCLVVPLVLSGCDAGFDLFGFGSRSVKSICKSNPELCEDLNRDGWCKKERSAVILSRFDEMTEVTEQHQYELIKNYQAYNFCIELAASIEPKYDKSRKTQRVIGLLTSLEELQRLENDTRDSSHPYLSMYHWTQYRDLEARDRFLALEGQAVLNQPDLQWTLAIHYSGKDAKKTINILQNAFKLFPENAVIPAKYAEAITSQYMNLKDYRHAYLWAQIASHFDDHSRQDYSGLNHKLKLSEEQQKMLKDEAAIIYEQIDTRQYRL
ncbi:DUF2989 domain-containing protein [Agarivorans sp. DSG3-1]|uniref:DUF2989 domain-containing protein n=1 Tax=Agarivorans sp. DSG3-1 TaxID=3342249 RepID=UPI00398F48B0